MITLSRLTTRTGDDGTTGLADGTRLAKHHPLIGAIGAVDEANSVLGLVRTEPLPEGLDGELEKVQNDLFDLGGDLACPPGTPHEERIPRITAAQTARLEAAVEAAVARLAPLHSFVLPGGTRAAAWLHLARTVVRRAERDLARAQAEGAGAKAEGAGEHRCAECLRYLNRLSDACFAWARRCNDEGRGDITWKPGANR